jgi:hypothetical protein
LCVLKKFSSRVTRVNARLSTLNVTPLEHVTGSVAACAAGPAAAAAPPNMARLISTVAILRRMFPLLACQDPDGVLSIGIHGGRGAPGYAMSGPSEMKMRRSTSAAAGGV